MITQQTAERIWCCYREIKAAEKILADMDAVKKEDWHNEHGERLRDAFGARRDLQLGVPSGNDGHRLFGVSPELARAVIVSHIAHQRAALVEMNEQARMELAGTVTVCCVPKVAPAADSNS